MSKANKRLTATETKLTCKSSPNWSLTKTSGGIRVPAESCSCCCSRSLW